MESEIVCVQRIMGTWLQSDSRKRRENAIRQVIVVIGLLWLCLPIEESYLSVLDGILCVNFSVIITFKNCNQFWI